MTTALDDKDFTERQIELYPDVYREYLHIEDALCSAYSTTRVTGNTEATMYKRLDELFRFFRFDAARSKHSTCFWQGARASSKRPAVNRA